MTDVGRKVIEILAAQALRDPASVSRDATIESLGLDSLGMVEAIFAIEEAFDISVPFNPNAPDEPGFDITSVASIIAEVEALVAGKAG